MKDSEQLQELTMSDKRKVVSEMFGFMEVPKNLLPEALVDNIVELRALKSMVEAREKLLTNVLKTRFEDDLEGLEPENCELPISGNKTAGLLAIKVWQRRLDTEAIEQEMGADWVEEHKKTIDFVQFRVAKE